MVMQSKKILYAVIILLLAAVLPLAASGNKETEVTAEGGVKSVTEEDMTVSWEISGDSVRFDLEAPTTGWLAIGFDPSSAMKDAQFIIAYVQEGEVFVRDDFGTGLFTHGSDEVLGGSDDISSAEGSEQDGKTAVSFTIPLDSGDRHDAVLASGKKHKLLIAYGRDGADDFSSKHQARGSVNITL